MAEGKMNDMISTSLSKIRELVDAQTIIGEPINTNGGTVIIPVSKVAVGYVSGGLDYSSKKDDQNAKPNAPKNFGGGGGTGVSVSPVGFLIVNTDGKVDFLPVGGGNGGGDSIDKVANLVERTPDILEKIKAVFSKKKPEEKQPDSTEETNA
jgi:sporulation protein YtfJ